jgi:membrane-associated protein
MFDLNDLLKTVGYVGIFAIIFAESGLLVGFFLPGDSLLFTAGFLASQGFFNIAILCTVTFFAAVIGDNVGYQFGKKAGPRLFKKKDSMLFTQENITRSENFYKKHGGKAIILSRFVPVVRTFAPIIAGVGNMHFKMFFIYNIVGAFIWAVGVTLLGYFLGQAIPHADKYLLPLTLVIIFVSIIPSLYHLVKDQESRAKIIHQVKHIRRNKSKKKTK